MRTKHSSHPKTTSFSAFSLVEVVLALGICSFAMMAIAGMIPVGLSTFREAMNTTVQARIVQAIAADILHTDSEDLTAFPPIYYNDQGTPLNTGSDAAYVAQIAAPVNLTQKAHDDSITPGKKVVIRIAKIHPGQSFQSVEESNPDHIYTCSVIVAGNE